MEGLGYINDEVSGIHAKHCLPRLVLNALETEMAGNEHVIAAQQREGFEGQVLKRRRKAEKNRDGLRWREKLVVAGKEGRQRGREGDGGKGQGLEGVMEGIGCQWNTIAVQE